MIKRFFLITLFVLFPVQLFAAAGDATRTYLHNQSLDAWVAMARGAVDDPVTYESLRGLPTGSVNDLAKFVLALVANGANPQQFFGHDYTSELLTQVKDGQIGDPLYLNDDAWGLLALRAAGIPAEYPSLQLVRRNLILTQSTDGGWSYVVGGGSDTNDTAAVIMALLEAGVAPTDSSLQRALGYLATQQNADGGFSYDRGQFTVSDAASDAWVVSALTKMGSDLSLWTKNGANVVAHLRSLLRPEGCFTWQTNGGSCTGSSITAWATIALEGKSYPIRSVRVAPPVPAQSIFVPFVPVIPATTPVITTPLPGGTATSISSRTPTSTTVTPITPGPYQDSDGDGYADIVELARGYDPYDPVPCPKIVYSTTLKNPYGGARLAHAHNEACRAQYLRKQVERVLGERLRLSARSFTTLTNAYLYGGYTIQDIAMAAKGAKTVHPTIYRDFWARRAK